MRLDRRSFLVAASLAAPVAALPGWAAAQNLSHGAFTHGVASGDPLSDSVILWTRFAHSGDGRVAWEISEDENFTRIAAHGQARSSLAHDFCVKADAGGLQAGRRYFYRFLSASGPSVTGMTRTAPRSGGDALTIAFFSCANLPFGYFHAYGHAAQRADVDLVLHLGDYIYEMARGAYPSARDALPGRIIDPVTEIVSFADYTQRYASYHADPDLLELRRLKPMSVVWDDHELVNDTWREGAKDHSSEFEGDFSRRIAAASKAYFDWMPLRRPDPRSPRLYRALDWGDLARIVLLDTRFIGRDRQLTTPRQLIHGAEIQSARHDFLAQLNDPNRSMLGRAQEAWLAQTLAGSKARGQTWQIMAQQVVMGTQSVPQGFTRFLPPDASEQAGRWFVEGEAMSQLGLPWNLDNWNGYPAARARLLDACVQHGTNAIVLSGDSHNCWLHNHPSESRHPRESRMAAIEFAGGSVSSPGVERTLTNAAPGAREAAMRGANPNLAWCDLTRRGYGAMRLTRQSCEAEWIGFDSVREAEAPAPLVTRFASEPSQDAGPGAWTTQG